MSSNLISSDLVTLKIKFIKDYVIMNGLCKPYFKLNKNVKPQVSIQGYTPQQIAKAYGLISVKNVQQVKIGIVSLGGIYSPSDIASAFSGWNLPVPTVQTITVDGARNTTDPGGANVENMLDVEWSAGIWSACTGQPAYIVFCSAPNSDNGIADAVVALANAGCKIISISWGAPISQWSSSAIAYNENKFQIVVNTQNVTVLVASGDNSADDGTNTPVADYPCSSIYSWAVGGTSLRLNSDGSVAQESAWGDGNSVDEGTGGGFCSSFAQPPWQLNAIGSKSPYRGVPDSSSVGDPNTGASVFCDGSWNIIGGTSWSTPTTAGYLAVCCAEMESKGMSWMGNLGPVLYPYHSTSFNDIITGSNGYPAAPGWDACTGMGSLNGAGMMSCLSGSIPSPLPPTPVPTPPSPPVPPTPPTPVPVSKYKLGLPNGLPAGIIRLRMGPRSVYTINNPQNIPPGNYPLG